MREWRSAQISTKVSDLKVAISLNTLDNNFRNDLDKASSVGDRIEALRELNKNSIIEYCNVENIKFERIDTFPKLLVV